MDCSLSLQFWFFDNSYKLIFLHISCNVSRIFTAQNKYQNVKRNASSHSCSIILFSAAARPYAQDFSNNNSFRVLELLHDHATLSRFSHNLVKWSACKSTPCLVKSSTLKLEMSFYPQKQKSETTKRKVNQYTFYI